MYAVVFYFLHDLLYVLYDLLVSWSGFYWSPDIKLESIYDLIF
jgi:hypothetical protein